MPADGWLTAYFDFRDFANGRVVSPNGTLEQPIDGTMTETKRAFTRQQVRWSALLLPSDQIFLLAARLGVSLQRLDQRLYLEDSNDPARGKPSFGFTLAGVNRHLGSGHDSSSSAIRRNSASTAAIWSASKSWRSTGEISIRSSVVVFDSSEYLSSFFHDAFTRLA